MPVAVILRKSDTTKTLLLLKEFSVDMKNVTYVTSGKEEMSGIVAITLVSKMLRLRCSYEEYHWSGKPP